MKHAREVMDLLGAYPGRPFRMEAILRYVIGQGADKRRLNAARTSIRLVLAHLIESGVVHCEAATKRGSYATYAWKELEKC